MGSDKWDVGGNGNKHFNFDADSSWTKYKGLRKRLGPFRLKNTVILDIYSRKTRSI